MQIKVYNDNEYLFKQDFRGQKIEIQPKGFVWMEEDFAHDFKCAFSPVTLDADGNPTKESYKMIRLEFPETRKKKTYRSACQKCGVLVTSSKDLDDHINAYHADDLLATNPEVDEVEPEKPVQKRAYNKKTS